jgi:phospholipid transport system substrate-binding protein
MHLVVVGLMIHLSMVSVCFADSKITSQLKDTIDKVIKIVKDDALKNDKPARRAALRKTIDERFNYRQMVMRSLAKNWDARSDRERQEFIALFKSLLENSYASKLEAYRDEKINYLDEMIRGEYALVKTEVVRRTSTIGVDYKLIQENGSWQVYDFVMNSDGTGSTNHLRLNKGIFPPDHFIEVVDFFISVSFKFAGIRILEQRFK